MKALIHVKIYDYHEYIPDGFIVFNEEVQKIGVMEEFEDTGFEIIDGQGKMLLPGLINFHTHIYSMLIRGYDIGAKPITFQDVLDQIWWKFDHHLNLDDLRLSAALYSDECLQNGVTAVIDHNASGLIQGSLEALESGLKIPSLLCFETSDRFDVDQCLEENSRKYLGLHASLSLSDETLSKAKAHIQPIHIHVAESLEDETDSWSQYDRSVVKRLKQHGLLRKDSILAHCVNIDSEEARLIGEYECKIALNPTSNMNNAVGTFPYSLFREHDIQLLVGTDGLGSNIARAWQNLFYVGKQSLGEPDGISLGEILNLIKNSYEYFTRMSTRKVGRITPGYASDFVLLEYINPTPMNSDNIFGHTFYGLFSHFHPESVYVGGTAQVKNYRLLQPANTDIQQVQKLWTRIQGGNHE